MSNEDGKFDGIFMSVIQQQQGIDGFFNEVFGFLRRKTDFFSNQKKAEEIIVNCCKVHFQKFQDDFQASEKAKQEKKQREEEKKKQLDAKKAAEQQAQNGSQKVTPPAPVEKKPEEQKEKTTEVSTTTTTTSETTETSGEKKEDNEPAPLGNGGKTDRYVWTQTLEETHINIPIDKELKGKDLKVKLTSERLFVSIKGTTFIDQSFPERIHEDDSLWTIEDSFELGKIIHVAIAKWKTNWHWWDCALLGDEKINTQKINPEPSNLSDLDGETRSTVEKMMFDMRQKQMGKPSSDELKKQDMMKDFMKAHPEMDFSKCKFN